MTSTARDVVFWPRLSVIRWDCRLGSSTETWALPLRCASRASTRQQIRVARRVQEAGHTPVWTTSEDNIALLRVARKSGFTEVSRRTYVVLDKSNSCGVLFHRSGPIAG